MPRLALPLYLFWCATAACWAWLALGKVPSSGDLTWLVRTREVCFGSLADGLPDVHGWISLAAPLPMLLALLVLMGSELKQDLLSRGRWVATSLALIPVLVVIFVAVRTHEGLSLRQAAAAPITEMPADYPETLQPCPPFSLTDQSGKSFGSRDLPGQVTVLTFAYAHCQTVCPMLMTGVRSVADSTRVVVVTLDPRRDTCGSLGGLARHWELPDSARLLSGSVEEVEKTVQAFGVPFERNASTGEISHPALVLVLDAKSQVLYTLNNPTPAWLQEAVRRAAAR